MVVLTAASWNPVVPYMAGVTGGRVGLMISPESGCPKTYPFLPYAIDNGRFQAVRQAREWDEAGFHKIIEKVNSDGTTPMFIVVPDMPMDAHETKNEFDKWAPRLENLGWPLAMAVQDGMTPDDVPMGIIPFIGGSTAFKQQWAGDFINEFPSVHVGRVNRFKDLRSYDLLGATSVDGSGFFREGYHGGNFQHLTRYFDWADTGKTQDPTLFEKYYG